MPLPLLLHLIALAVLVLLPGLVLYETWLKRLGVSWRIALGLVIAALTVLFSDLAAAFGYSLGLMLTVNLILILVASGWYASRLRAGDPSVRRPSALLDALKGTLRGMPLFHVALFTFFTAPVFVLFLPLDTDAQGFGYLALMVREGGTIHTLAPWHPEVQYLYSPGLFVWWAYFSDLLNLPLHQVMLPFSHVMAGFMALSGIDLGKALMPGRDRAGWLFPLMLTGGLGLFLTLMDSAYTSVMALMLVTLFLTLGFGAMEDQGWTRIALSAAALASVALTHPDTIIILLIAYIPFYFTFWLSHPAYRDRAAWLRFFVFIPLLGVLLTLPWMLRVLPLFFLDHVVSPFQLSRGHVVQLTLYQGLLVPLIGLAGVGFALWRRRPADLLMLTWLLMILDFSMFGMVERIGLLTGVDLMRYVYPFSVAWHGPPIAYAYFAAAALDEALERFPVRLPERALRIGSGAAVALMGLAVILSTPILNASAGWLNFFGTFSSRADLHAMDYLRENSPADSLILNYPPGFEAHWVSVIAERDSVIFRDQPFFANPEDIYRRMDRFREVYFDLGNSEAESLVREYGVDYVIVPQIINNPDSFGEMENSMRWRWPEEAWYPLGSDPGAIPWLTLVFEADGAQVYQVINP